MSNNVAIKKGLDSIFSSASQKFWLEEELDKYLENKTKDFRSTGFHASSAGMCPRWLQLQGNAIVSDRPDAKLQRIFDNGKWTHLRYHDYFAKSGALIKHEVPIKLEFDGFIVVGSADFVIKNAQGNLFIIELKTINAKGFEELFSSGHKKEHFEQWNIYSKGLDIKDGVIVYENKDSQELKMFPVKYSPEIFDKSIGVFRLIAECNKKGIVVPKPDKCLNQYCRAKQYCREEK